MLLRASLVAAMAAICVNQVIGAAVEGERNVVRDVEAVDIATSPYYACNCPNNCSHKEGSSCKFYSGPSDNSHVDKGKCEWQGNQLNCVAQ